MLPENSANKPVEEISLTIFNSDISNQSEQPQKPIEDTITYLPLAIQQIIFAYAMPPSWKAFKQAKKLFQKSFIAPFWKSAQQDPYFPFIQRFQKQWFIWDRMKSSLSTRWGDAFMHVALDIIQDELKACSPKTRMQIMANAYMQLFEPSLIDSTLIYSNHPQHVAIKKKLTQMFYTKHSTMSPFNRATAKLKMNSLMRSSIDYYLPTLISSTLSQGTTSSPERYGKVSHLQFLRDKEKSTEANAFLLSLTTVPMIIFFLFAVVSLIASLNPQGNTDKDRNPIKRKLPNYFCSKHRLKLKAYLMTMKLNDPIIQLSIAAKRLSLSYTKTKILI